jgi:hypothetical protein
MDVLMTGCCLMESFMSLELVREAGLLPVDFVTEANHRIANHLSILAGLLRMESASISKQREVLSAEEIRFVLEEVGSRLETVAEVHRLLAPQAKWRANRYRRLPREYYEGNCVWSFYDWRNKPSLRIGFGLSFAIGEGGFAWPPDR